MRFHDYSKFIAFGFGLILLFPNQSWAIPAFARMYGIACGACHSAFPALNDAGEEFRLSGFRKYNGLALIPQVASVKLGERLELPGTIPLSLSTTAGFNATRIDNTLGDGSKNTNTEADFKRQQSSFNLNEFKFLAGAPLGKDLAFFLDAPLTDTESRQFFDPEARAHGVKSKTESGEAPYLAFISYHNLFVPDLVNLKGGIIEVPTAFSPSIHRLSFFPYLVYEATTLDVISRKGVDDIVSVPGVVPEALESNQFRLSKGQVGAQLFGRAMPSLHQISNLYVDYAVGLVNGNNINSDNNTTKDIFGRLAFTYKLPTTTLALGWFSYHSANTLDNLTTNPDTAAGYRDQLRRDGPDFRLTLNEPVYINFYSQILFAKDSNPTGFGQEAKWWGGFVQAEVKPHNQLVVYGRYDWIRGNHYDDTGIVINGASGSIGPVDPKLWDIVAGAQYFLYDNFKLIAEYRHGEKDLGSVPADPGQLKKTVENAVFTGVRLVF
jgi:hypothetical protein